MRRALSLALLVTLPALWACAPEDAGPEAGEAPAAEGLDAAGLAEVVGERMALEEGEDVLLVARPGRFDALVDALREEVEGSDARDLGVWAVEGPVPQRWTTAFTEALAEAPEEELPDLLREVDVGVMLPGAEATHPVYGAMQEVLRSGRGRTVHFHWAGAYRLDGTEFEPDEEVDAVYQRAVAGTDYEALAAAQRRFEEAMREGTVRVTTPAGTDLSFRIGGRPVTKQDGDASAARARRARNLIDREVELPGGAVRVAPLESSVEGRIVFPPSSWGGERVEELTLRFEEGTAVEVTAASGLDAALAEIEEAGPAGRAFREFALGFNPLLAVPEEGRRWIPYYGYGAGVVRLSLGDNTELGGAVGGGYVRWNFFVDATVTVDGTTWVEEGRLVR